MAMHAMHTTTGLDGITPCMLVYGRMPRYPAELFGDDEARTQEERMSAMNTARENYLTFVCQARVKKAMKSRVPAATDFCYVPGEYVLLYRKRKKTC